jgi:capsular polysaccharide export protein
VRTGFDEVTPLPFLRSPPFPGIAPRVAAVSILRERTGEPDEVPDSVIEQIAAARVGGAYWGRQRDGVKLVARAGCCFSRDGLDRSEVVILPLRQPAKAYDPWALVAQARSVHAKADDELAIIAGMLGVAVHGPDGEIIAPERLRLEAKRAVAAATYRDCFSGKAVGVDQAIAQLAEWGRHLQGNRHIAAASGMAFWKREAMRRFLWDGLRSPPFLSPRAGVVRARREGGALAIWPSRVPSSLQADAPDIVVARVEDGFLRSKGLGAALTPPGSVVIDRSGIYYDAGRPSDLETLLATHAFSTTLVERARRLRETIRATGVTKYGQDAGQMPSLPADKRTVLVVGQVEDDLSVQLGGAGVEGNLGLLKRARQAEPDAHIIYRPHPDVQAGLRRGHLSDAVVHDHADALDSGAPLMALVQAVDDVHVLSSLTGFEALLRDRPVTVHGMPFYAGWGLTRDLAEPNPRRGRKLTIDQLVAAALILYPRYLDPVTCLPCGPEIMVERLGSGSTSSISWLIRMRTLQGKIRRFMTVSAERLHG